MAFNPSVIYFLIILTLVYFVIKRKFDYWKNRHVPHLKPSYLFGNYKDHILLKRYSGFVAQDICRKFPNERYIGTYFGSEPALIIQDPELIKLVMTKEFYYFSGREITKYSKCETITRCLFFNGGNDWKILRQNETLLFSSYKMKNMFYLIQNCRDTFEEILRKEITECYEVEAKSLATRYIMDCIGSCVFGINTEVMTNNANSNIFAVMGAEIFNASTLRGLKIIVRSIWPSIFYGLRLQLFAPEIQNFFNQTLTEVFQSRQFKASSRNDFVDLLTSWKKMQFLNGTAMSPNSDNKTPISLKVTNEMLVAQCVELFAAGFETSATIISLALYELAKNKNAQAKLIQEVDEYLDKTNGKVEYGCIKELPYLEACLDETMRLYPLFGVLTRETMDDYTLPSGLRLEKGLRIHIPVYHLHHNPKYFPDPEKFIPERFHGEEKKKVTPYTFLPFGGGPRICIGARFSKMQMFPAFLTIFKDYEIELMENMPNKLDFAPAAIVTHTINSIHLKFIKRYVKD